jgi:hypothetical protein
MRATKVNLSILLGFTMFVSGCGLHGSAQPKHESQQKPVAPDTQEVPKKLEALESDRKEWLDYWPAVVQVEGKLNIKTFFGPPNFGENPD